MDCTAPRHTQNKEARKAFSARDHRRLSRGHAQPRPGHVWRLPFGPPEPSSSARRL